MNFRLVLPIVAERVPAGFPSPAADYEVADLDLGKLLIRNKPATFLVRASGDSMRDAGIQSGSLLVVDRSVRPVDGSIVVAAIDGEHTVKYFRRRGRRAWLQPASAGYPEIELSDDLELIVFGVVMHIITSLSDTGHVCAR